MSQELPRPGDAWDEARKSAIVSQIATGQIGVDAACRRYGIGADQIQDWLREYRRSAMLAYDERLQQTLIRQGADPAALAPAEFTGGLQDLSVPDLIQSLQIAGKSGVIVVTHEGLQSRIWCAAGAVIDADSGHLGGEAALYRILSFEHGRVTAVLRPVARERTIHASTPGLLLEAAYRKDKSARIWRKLDSESPLASSGSPSRDTRDSMSSFLTSTGTRLSQRAATRRRLVPGWAWAALAAAGLLSFTLWPRVGASPRDQVVASPSAVLGLEAPAEVPVEVPAGASSETQVELPPAAAPAPPVASPAVVPAPPVAAAASLAPPVAPAAAIATPPATVLLAATPAAAPAPPSPPRLAMQTRAVSPKLVRRALPPVRQRAVTPARRPEAPRIQKIDPELPHIQVIE